MSAGHSLLLSHDLPPLLLYFHRSKGLGRSKALRFERSRCYLQLYSRRLFGPERSGPKPVYQPVPYVFLLNPCRALQPFVDKAYLTKEICLESSTPAQGKCSNVDIGCLCSNVEYSDVLACCLSKTCNAADQQGMSIGGASLLITKAYWLLVAQAFNQALCAGVNVIIPNFLGCGNASTTRSSAVVGPASTTVHQAGIELAVTVPTTGAVANFNGHALLTGTCSIAHPVLATVDNGGLMEYPRLGCSNEDPGCCPFDIHVGGPLSVCPEDYTTTSGACCPS